MVGAAAAHGRVPRMRPGVQDAARQHVDTARMSAATLRAGVATRRRRVARRANPQAQREHAARVARHRANASVEARWHAKRYAATFARRKRPWFARDAGGRRVRTGDAVTSFVVTADRSTQQIRLPDLRRDAIHDRDDPRIRGCGRDSR